MSQAYRVKICTEKLIQRSRADKKFNYVHTMQHFHLEIFSWVDGTYGDSTQLIFLRARWYNPADGRFTSRDTWGGSHNLPQSLNRWNYTQSNPINYFDPTGHISEKEGIKADNISLRLVTKGVVVYKDWGIKEYTNPYVNPRDMPQATCLWQKGRWDIKDLIYIDEAIKDLEEALRVPGKIRAAVGRVVINKMTEPLDGMMSPPSALNHVFYGDIIVLDSATSSNEEWYKYTIVHEFGHVWDYRSGNSLSYGLMVKLRTWICTPYNYEEGGVGENCEWDTSQSIEPPPDTCADPTNTSCTNNGGDPYPYSSSYGNGGRIFTGPGAEDWATALGYYVYTDYKQPDVIGLRKVRRQYVKKQIANLP
jgi:RHS repeat-associated protein